MRAAGLVDIGRIVAARAALLDQPFKAYRTRARLIDLRLVVRRIFLPHHRAAIGPVLVDRGDIACPALLHDGNFRFLARLRHAGFVRSILAALRDIGGVLAAIHIDVGHVTPARTGLHQSRAA